MNKLVLSLVAATAALTAAPALAQGHSVPIAKVHYRDNLATTLGARILSINTRIDMLRDRDAIGRDEARGLREEARRLQLRLYGMSRREAGDVELGIDRLESQVRVASDDARWGGHAFNRELDESFDDSDRYEGPRYELDRPNYSRSGAYTGSSVDRWHDPFDRGN